MRKTSEASEPAIITVGELISALSRWPDHAAVTFRCSADKKEMRFYRMGAPSPENVEIELDPASESAPVVPV